MELALYISASIALLALAALFVYLIFFINGTRVLVEGANTAVQTLIGEVSGLRVALTGTIQNLEGIAGKMETTVARVNALLDDADGIVGNARMITTDATEVVHGAKNIVVSVLGFVDNVQTSVQRPISEVANIVSALGAWIGAFRTKLGLKTHPPAPTDPSRTLGR